MSKVTVGEQAVEALNNIFSNLGTVRLQSGKKAHKKIQQLTRKYKKRKLLTSKDVEVINSLSSELKVGKFSPVTKRAEKERAKSKVYQDLNTLLTDLYNIASNQSHRKDKEVVPIEPEPPKVEPEVSILEDVKVTGEAVVDILVDNLSADEQEAREDVDDIFDNYIGYTDKDGNFTRDLYMYQKDSHARTLTEHDFVYDTLVALREELGDIAFKDFIESTERTTGQTLYGYIHDNYVLFNLDSDNPQYDFMETISRMLSEMLYQAGQSDRFKPIMDKLSEINELWSKRDTFMNGRIAHYLDSEQPVGTQYFEGDMGSLLDSDF